MASQSLYRKWRSQNFGELVGQEGVARALLNAAREGRLAHAYLFCGPRGTGKTSVARLLAKAVNCQNPRDGEPCNECVSCQEITAGRSPDVIEIDAASNTGVDNIRELREHVNMLGSGGHHKVYVIDEVHMLSTAAFNALLKTLEEPPPHVIFVLATTEAHKVLPTIISRCQRFDFHRIRMRDIVSHLRHVAQGEGLTLEPAAAEMIARAAQGGMRDALSLLDQAITVCGAQIDGDSVRRMLGLADPATLRALIEAVADQQTATGLEIIHMLVASGAELRQLNAQYAEEWRALMLARAGADVATIMDRTADEAQATLTLASRFSLEELAACARVFARNEQPARGLPVPQLALELAFLECVAICGGGGSQLTAPQAQAQAPARPTPTPRTSPAMSSKTPPAPTRTFPAMPPEPEPESDVPIAEDVPAAAPIEVVEVGDVGSGAGVASVANAASISAQSSDAPLSRKRGQQPSQPSSPPVRQDPALLDTLRDIQRRWTMIKKVCKQQSSMVSGLMNDAQPIQLDPGSPPSLVVAVKWPFHLEKLREPSKREAVEWALEQVVERPMRVRLVLASEGGSGQPAAQQPTRPQSGPPAGPQRPPDAPTPPSRPDTSAPSNIVPFPTTQSGGATGGATGTSSKAQPPQPTQPMRLREAPAAALPDAMLADAPDLSGSYPADVAALEREVRADPVIQELIRIGGTELAEVRALRDDER